MSAQNASSPGPAPCLATAFALSFLGLPLGLHCTRLAALADLSCGPARRGCVTFEALHRAGSLLVVAGVFALSFLVLGALALAAGGARVRRRARKGAKLAPATF